MIPIVKKYRLEIIKGSLISGYISALISSVIAPEYMYDDAYYHFMELAFVFYLLGFYLLTRGVIDKFTGMWESLMLLIFLSSVSVIVDELFYDTTKVEWNDLIRFIVIIIVSFRKKYRWKA